MNRFFSPEIENRINLVQVVQGREAADFLVQNARILNVFTGEIFSGDIVVKGERIAYSGPDGERFCNRKTAVRDVQNKFIIPGLIDAHVHIESSMLTPSRYAEIAIDHGITAVAFDPHEIANVSGLKGVKWFVEDLERSPIKPLLTVPSCIPASSAQFETTGAKFGLEEIKIALGWPSSVALGEMMNFPGILACKREEIEKIEAARESGVAIEGHASGLMDSDLAGYISAGIESDHESSTKEQGMERINAGMWTYIREGSGWKDLERVIKGLTEEELPSDRVCLVTDDRDPVDLIKEGGVDHVVRRAIEEGIDPRDAIAMATLNPAKRFGLSNQIGSLAPGRRADFLLVRDLERLDIEQTFIGGKPARNIRWNRAPPPSAITKSFNLRRKIIPENFRLSEAERKFTIEIQEGNIATKLHRTDQLPSNCDLTYCSVIERHKNTGNMTRVYVKGFGFERGAIASSVAHDSHNLIVVGVNFDDMAYAARRVVQLGGGQVIAENKSILAEVKLPVGGLMADRSPRQVSADLERVKKCLPRLGIELSQPLMILSSLALPVIPEGRITDKGVIDVRKFKLVA